MNSTGLDLYPRSVVSDHGLEYGLAHLPDGQRLAVLGEAGNLHLAAFEGEHSEFEQHTLLMCALNHQNAETLRNQLNWLQPILLGLNTSAGMGDRLGIATPGHVRAVRGARGNIAPIFAQQSIREMQRTNRTPKQVLDDATWGAFEEGWQVGMGADADHLKTEADIETCLEAGFTLFTFDPGAYVSQIDPHTTLSQLREQAEALPGSLQAEATGLLDRVWDIEGYRIKLDEATLLKAIIKYGRAIDHVAALYRHLENTAGNRPFEVEISMDETDAHTTAAEHVYISSELRRLGVKWVSFAPRFIGSFEKGVDYIGDVEAFAQDLAVHSAIARQLGPYKLSLHSGSDKFSLYPVFIDKTQGLAHLKTAGTSYLEGLRTIASVDMELFREIYLFALSRFEADRSSYHVSASITGAPRPDEIDDWPRLLDQFDAREILHVTFGSVLTEKSADGQLLFRDRLMGSLQENRERYFGNLADHFIRHLQPFATQRDA
ncbi:MAG: tagaturonate epimerase family protein [Acidobacteriaceae bacterium]